MKDIVAKVKRGYRRDLRRLLTDTRLELTPRAYKTLVELFIREVFEPYSGYLKVEEKTGLETS